MSRLRLLVSDLAGTVIDHGCQAPVGLFQRAFSRVGVTVSARQVRGPMGKAKLEHVRALFAIPTVQQHWRDLYKRDPTEDDTFQVYNSLATDQEELLLAHSKVISSVVPAFNNLRNLGLKTSACSGYNNAMVNILRVPLSQQGLRFDHIIASDEVAQGRPAPDMIQHLMKLAGVTKPAEVIKIGDTPVDIAEGHSAGTWTVGVLRSSSELGLSAEDYDSLSFTNKRQALFVAGS